MYFQRCFDGWTGENCTQCLKMAGCLHGDCGEHPNTCICEPNFEGHLCDQPICEWVVFFVKSILRIFFCEIDFTKKILLERGIVSTILTNFHLRPGCANGECIEGPEDATTGIPQDNFCICEVGWGGPACDQPICYWQCETLGGTCTQPNQCICSEADPICENPLINPAFA